MVDVDPYRSIVGLDGGTPCQMVFREALFRWEAKVQHRVNEDLGGGFRSVERITVPGGGGGGVASWELNK